MTRTELGRRRQEHGLSAAEYSASLRGNSPNALTRQILPARHTEHAGIDSNTRPTAPSPISGSLPYSPPQA
jgi:hypothetical protein